MTVVAISRRRSAAVIKNKALANQVSQKVLVPKLDSDRFHARYGIWMRKMVGELKKEDYAEFTEVFEIVTGRPWCRSITFSKLKPEWIAPYRLKNHVQHNFQEHHYATKSVSSHHVIVTMIIYMQNRGIAAACRTEGLLKGRIMYPESNLKEFFEEYFTELMLPHT